MATKTKTIPKFKAEVREDLKRLLTQYKGFLAVDLYRARARLINEVRKKQEDWGFVIKGAKNTLFRIALSEVAPNAYERVKDRLRMPTMFIFTDDNPCRLALKLNELEVDLPASPGDIATDDIIVEAGNTGFPPGPIISLFTAANIPTRVISGAIHISKDVKVASKGDRISMELANILGKLKKTPIRDRINLKFAYDLRGDIFIPKELLLPNIGELTEKLIEAYRKAVGLGIELGYPTKVTIPILLQRGYIHARALALEMEYPTPETIRDLLTLGIVKARALEKIAQSAS
jgi:large subunit ribosomal protein L10